MKLDQTFDRCLRGWMGVMFLGWSVAAVAADPLPMRPEYWTPETTLDPPRGADEASPPASAGRARAARSAEKLFLIEKVVVPPRVPVNGAFQMQVSLRSLARSGPPRSYEFSILASSESSAGLAMTIGTVDVPALASGAMQTRTVEVAGPWSAGVWNLSLCLQTAQTVAPRTCQGKTRLIVD
ncbi:hypothetical protein QTH87_20700 [Variovorax sp. J22P168]|uniref:hypothetical protein n=1 Tax=Variovorax jilinensis TaxID=3053513 RepID=UPI0025765D79|nr:hypothetical protein [Variovorax sp. J22P168]MDM0014876.1 hypothetical protein [Variovorax sp. J22P168]